MCFICDRMWHKSAILLDHHLLQRMELYSLVNSFNWQWITCVGQLQLCIQHSKAGKKIVEDAPKAEHIDLSQGGKPDSENVLEIVEEAKHLNMDSGVNGSQEDHSQDDVRWVQLSHDNRRCIRFSFNVFILCSNNSKLIFLDKSQFFWKLWIIVALSCTDFLYTSSCLMIVLSISYVGMWGF